MLYRAYFFDALFEWLGDEHVTTTLKHLFQKAPMSAGSSIHGTSKKTIDGGPDLFAIFHISWSVVSFKEK